MHCDFPYASFPISTDLLTVKLVSSAEVVAVGWLPRVSKRRKRVKKDKRGRQETKVAKNNR